VGTLLPAGANAADSTITPATPTPTATCAPTGTPYCSNNCVPCPTIRPDCYVSACGWCIQNPTCASNEGCVPTDNLNINGCCSCATVTPTPTPTPTVLVYCTPPQCQAGEVFYCPGECPGGCGTQCGTPTPVPATSTATPTPSPTLAWTPSPTACGVETPLVDPIISPTNLVQQSITGTARLTGARFLEISSEAGAFRCDSPGSSCTAGSFAITVTLLPNQTNHLTVCEGNENYCGGPVQACTELDRNGSPLDIVQISGMPTFTATPTATCAPTGTPYCSNNCVPCPTIRPDCYVSACGWCIQNPTCVGNEACVPTDNLNINGCCSCATVTPSPTTSATPVPPTPSCVGSCNGDAQVTVDEILTMVNIALGNADASACDAGDKNQDGQITVDEILTAVNNALNACSP
jgi:hypothetical protein